MCDTLSKNHINAILTKTHKQDPLILPKEALTETQDVKDLKIESERVKTFKNWNDAALSPQDLARVGFYCCGNKAKCCYCHVEISLSSFGESPLDDHLRYSPSCPFARGKKGQRTLSTFLRDLPESRDVCGQIDPYVIMQKIAHPYEDFNARLKSFENWPKTSKQKPELLAAAGFYYPGFEDKTVCFRCSGPLKNWEDDDDPWEQHALWYPKCKFVLDKKGQGFVDEIQKKSRGGTENQEICCDGVVDEDRMCIICCSCKRGTVLIPCGHDWTCMKCINALEDKKCPICREQIVQIQNL